MYNYKQAVLKTKLWRTHEPIRLLLCFATNTDAHKALYLLTAIFQALQLQLQRACAGIGLLLQQLKLGSVDLRQANALGLHLQPALTLKAGRRDHLINIK